MTRKPLSVANWKMYVGAREALRAAERIQALAAPLTDDADVVVCPSFPQLSEFRRMFEGTKIALGAQDVSTETDGPYTGDVSVMQLQDIARYVIVGHSERRAHYGETDEIVAVKTRRVLRAGMVPIICVGETTEERSAGHTIDKIRHQVGTILSGLPVLELPRLVFAYEPVWAISPGLGQHAEQPASGEVAEVVGLIRKIAADSGNRNYADKMRVLYGGSVTAKTVGAFVAEPGVDGALVGSASTQPGEFVAITKEIIKCHL